ncbi:MAG: ATP-binding cassette domain-containing protein [Desulfopila sp.]|jgi:ABC-2 type transport system ATP-binding protein|nr:ATP-binding cassette domain-containing protein [Desulfopila sp.]
MISVENVTRKYGDFVAVDDVSFSISPGEIVGLLGHNGAGKTTIMKMLTGYLEPTAGTITINGREIICHLLEVQNDIGYLPENCPIYQEMTVVDYLDYSAALHNIPVQQRSSLVLEAIARTALTEKAHQSIATLSRGYRQRVGVAQAILHKPSILILDEPANGLDPTQIEEMRRLIKELAAYTTIILSTHILQEVRAVCDRVIIIKNGRKALDTSIAGLQENSRLIVSIGSEQEDPMNILAAVNGVNNVEVFDKGATRENISCFALTLPGRDDREKTAALVAKTIHENGWSLFSLAFETRDLESVFAEIGAQ